MNFLKRKAGPLPVWAWALVVAVLGYILYKRYAGSSGATTSSVPGSTVGGTDTTGAGTGTDLTSSGIGSNPGGDITAATDPNATAPLPDAGIAREIKDWISGDLTNWLDTQQGNTANGTTDGTSGAPDGTGIPGLTHISGDWWWDSTNNKLVKVPGSGGKTAAPPGAKKSGKSKSKKPKPPKKKVAKTTHPILIKRKVLPAKTRSLSKPQARAVAHVTPRPVAKPHLVAKKKIVKGKKITPHRVAPHN